MASEAAEAAEAGLQWLYAKFQPRSFETEAVKREQTKWQTTFCGYWNIELGLLEIKKDDNLIFHTRLLFTFLFLFRSSAF